ncbi:MULTISPECIES: hypothetical protein [unclassified Chelatococcus]|uniref:hypothetical protein n=1 Tax=unclassified Chelatococcus TaxID=2638111 RepID=UPI0002F38E92|nr:MULTISPECIES: hypothetical protein [unclassified Chelatococcus]ALA16096.1 hypothetical protein AL346_00160 [Chelatococcus sp. CO-6]
MRIAIVACAVLVGGCVSAQQTKPVWFDMKPGGVRRSIDQNEMDLAACRFAAQSAMQGRAPFVPSTAGGVRAGTSDLIGAMSMPEAPSIPDCMLAKGWRYLGQASSEQEADRLVEQYQTGRR